MLKIAISGKANAGKDTVAKAIYKIYRTDKGRFFHGVQFAALADPIKEMIRIMFPRTKRKLLYGASKYRSEIIPGAFSGTEPLTYRKLLQELGTDIGRGYKEDVWLDALDYKLDKAAKRNYSLFIVTDVRFRNEFDHLKDAKYIIIRVKRDEQSQMKHFSETEQEDIKDNEFDFVIDNNGTLDELNNKIAEILAKCPV